MQLSKLAINPYGTIGFGLASIFSVIQGWSLPEFCWSTWLAGLFYSWGCIAAASLQIILTARSAKPAYDERFPLLKRISPAAFLIIMTGISISIGMIGFRLYTTLFGFYGLFLSVFAEMEPISLFGRNGFINSDFFTPLMYLVHRFWPMAAGVLITNWEDFFLKTPWKRIVLPFQAEILRIHIMTLALPFLSLLAWAMFKGSYQPVTIVFLMGIFYFLPKGANRETSKSAGDPNPGMQSDAAEPRR
jgi:hypothetical protein